MNLEGLYRIEGFHGEQRVWLAFAPSFRRALTLARRERWQQPEAWFHILRERDRRERMRLGPVSPPPPEVPR